MRTYTEIKNLNKKLLAVLIVTMLSASFFVVAASFASYTQSSRAQRTIATYDSGGELFSSNHLLKGDSKNNVKTIYTAAEDVEAFTWVTVCNYRQNHQSNPNKEDIDYVVSYRLVYESDGSYLTATHAYLAANELTGEEYAVTIKKGDSATTVVLGDDIAPLSDKYSDTETYSGTLIGNAPNSDSYSLTFGTGFAENTPNLYLEMVVSQDAVSPTLAPISAIFGAAVKGEGLNTDWSGRFNDDTSGGEQPSDYVGFNYVVEGTGKGTFTLKWDSTRVELSDRSKIMLGVTVNESATYHELTVTVDSDEISHYDLQFYKVDIDSETWGEMNKKHGEAGYATAVVVYDFTPANA